MAELEALDLAEVVAVDLVGERPVALDGQRVEVGADVELLAPAQLTADAERRAGPPSRVWSLKDRNETVASPRSSEASESRLSGRLPR